MTPRTKDVVRTTVIAVADFIAGISVQYARGPHRESLSSKPIAFQDYELVLEYFTEWEGIRFLHTNSSSLELVHGGTKINIFEGQREFQESHRQVNDVKMDGNTILWDDGLDSYRLTVTPSPKD